MSVQNKLEIPDIFADAAMLKPELLDIQKSIATALSEEEMLITSLVDQFNPDDEVRGLSGIIDTRIEKRPMIAPYALSKLTPVTKNSAVTTLLGRSNAADILNLRNDRLAVDAGPCSIHDPIATLEYANHVAEWREQFKDTIEIFMRFYSEKPRTPKPGVVEWKGFAYDPMLDGSHDINLGLIATRLLARHITKLGVPLASERLNTLTPQYLNGLISIDVIGARNAQDQKAIEYASGTSSVVGIKNTIDGNIEASVGAVASARLPHTFLGQDMFGFPAEITTTGNEAAHLVLRGSEDSPNYSAVHVLRAIDLLTNLGLPGVVVIDLSHGNSGKVAVRQLEGAQSISQQITDGETGIVGVHIESNLVAGSQKLIKGRRDELVYGQSITDECIGLEDTETILAMLSKAVIARRNK